jgi:hypothetical protein
MNLDCNPIDQQARQDRLEELYEADGRHDPAHPQHALYTGLAAAQSCDAAGACPCRLEAEQ